MGVERLTIFAAAGLFAATAATAQTTAPAPAASPSASPAARATPASPGASPTTQAAPVATATPGAPAAAAPAGTPAAAAPAGTPIVGGAPMLPTKTIVENASAASNLTTLVSAVKAADLVGTLSGPGPFTVFAPDNDAFGRLAPGTLDTLLKPENKPTLAKVLKYHVVPGNLDAAALKSQIAAGGGSAKLTTAAGDTLTVTEENNVFTLTDVGGNKAYVAQPDVKQSNGVVHVINGVVVPNLTAAAPADGTAPAASATPAATATPRP